MKKKPKISIINYGVGNLRSLIRAFEYFGSDIAITEEAQKVRESDAIVLPGDGAFAAGMEGLAVRNLTNAVLDLAKAQKPILGICLGAQILLSTSFEFGKYTGLSLVKGRVVKFPQLEGGEKVPQMGWNSIYPPKGKRWKNTILDKIKLDSSVYFVHSYIIEPADKKDILALSNYGRHEFCSVITKGNIYGCQFHPEKSGKVGLLIINNFIKIVG